MRTQNFLPQTANQMKPELDPKVFEPAGERRNSDLAPALTKELPSAESLHSGKLGRSRGSAFGSWFAGLFLGAGLPALVALVAARAMEISGTEAGTNTLELIVFLGASALLVTQKRSHNFRLATEITVWLATANMLAFKYLPTAGAVTAAVVLTIVSSFLAYRRGKV